MEVVIVWFWVLKIIVTSLSIYILIKVVQNKFKSKFYNIIVILLLLFWVFSPIKIDATNSLSYKTKQNQVISNNKELPEKVIAENFQKLDTKKIQEEDLK